MFQINSYGATESKKPVARLSIHNSTDLIESLSTADPHIKIASATDEESKG